MGDSEILTFKLSVIVQAIGDRRRTAMGQEQENFSNPIVMVESAAQAIAGEVPLHLKIIERTIE